MSNTDLIGTITIDFGDTTEKITENNYKEILDGLDAMIGGCYNGNDIIDEKLEEFVEKFYETHGAEEREKLIKSYDALIAEQKENQEIIKKCEATVELIEKFAEIRGWE